ncbi:M48 family metalloprotease [Micromonospora sp. NPDC051006]|uniref:M48 family metalloprotease n=1 Tax=Micromonospora sp. NPDC051006 TaxID=3364283 RepID=UPI0037B47B3B
MTAPDPGAPAERPRPLLWLYGLIALTLLSVGQALGYWFFFGMERLVVPYETTSLRCRALYGRPAATPSTSAYDSCMAGQLRTVGYVLLGGALLLVACALLLAVLVPRWDQRRLRRHGRFDLPPADQRFADLCRRNGLTGRRAPRLWVAGPAVRHAFTTALPGRRPTIVVPARLALEPGARFDAVVTHEIGHVLARDVTWVSVVRGLLWLLVPVAVVASVPAFNRIGYSARNATVLLEVSLLAVVMAVLTVALLRLREHQADRYAARGGAETELSMIFGRAAESTVRPERSRIGAALRRLLSRHPDPARRLLALHDERTFEGGFAQALAVGFVAVMAMGTVTTLAMMIKPGLYAWGQAVIVTAVGAAVLTLLLPSLFRRARERAAPPWWRPVTGTAAGMALAAVVSPVVSAPGMVAYPATESRHAAAAVAMLALAGAGVCAVAVGLATLAARGERPTAPRVGLTAAGLVAFAGTWPVAMAAGLVELPDALRSWWAYGLIRNAWPALAVALFLVALVLLRGQSRHGARPDPDRYLPWLVAFAAAVVASIAAILVTAERADLAEQVQAQQQRWWICVTAGLVVLAVTALVAPGPYAWARGVLAATAATVGATAAYHGYARLAGRPAEPDASVFDLGVAPVWLFYGTVLLAPVLVPLAGRSADGPARRWSWVSASASTVAATVLAVLLVVSVGVPGGTALNARQIEVALLAERYAPARRVLTDAQAERVAQAAVLVLPPTWSRLDNSPVGDGIVSPRSLISERDCEPLIRERFLALGAPHLRATGTRTFSSEAGESLRYTDLTITVYSYDRVLAETILGAARDARLTCSAFALGEPPNALDFTVEQADPPGIGEWSWRYDAPMRRAEVTGSNAYAMIAAGNTIIVVHMLALQEPLDEQLLRRVLANALDALLHPL